MNISVDGGSTFMSGNLDLVSFRQACELLGVTVGTAERWVNDPTKDFPRPFFIGSRRFYRRQDLADYVNAKAEEALRNGSSGQGSFA